MCLQDCRATKLSSQYTEERIHTDHLTKTLLSFQKSRQFCDTTILTCDDPLYAHSVVLAAACPDLLSQLNQMPDFDDKRSVIDFSKYDSMLIQEMIEFLYTGHLESTRLYELSIICQNLGVTLKIVDLDSHSVVNQLPVSIKDEHFVDEFHFENVTTHLEASADEQIFDLYCEHETDLADENKSDPQLQHIQIIPFAKDCCDFTLNSEGNGLIASHQFLKENKTLTRSTKLDSANTNSSAVLKVKIQMQGNASKTSGCLQSISEVPGNYKEKNITNKLGSGNIDENRTCAECKEKFKTQKALKLHRWTHYLTSDGFYQCNICGKMFKESGYLRKHISRHFSSDQNQPKRHLCPLCGNRFRAPNLLRDHLNVHTGAKPHVCKMCSKRFSTDGYMKEHIKYTHTNWKGYLCTYCGKVSRLHKSHTIHMRTHTGQRPYVCEVCGHGCSQVTALKDHMRKHTNEKPQQCMKCGRRFGRIQQLRMHIMTVHTDNVDKPFPCEQCGKSYSHKFRLHMHMNCHNKPFVCSACGRKFATKSHLARHSEICKCMNKTILNSFEHFTVPE